MNDYTWDYIQAHPKETKRWLGLDYESLKELMEFGKFIHQRKKQEQEKQKIRINQAGGGNHPKLSEESQIVLMRVYLRHHLSFQILGLRFQVSESTAHKVFTYWQEIFQES